LSIWSILDVAFFYHEFGGNHMADVSRNGELRNTDPAKLLEAAARAKVRRYQEAYATQSGVAYACVMSTSSRRDPWRVFSAARHPRPPPN